jgi:hypothetical protein
MRGGDPVDLDEMLKHASSDLERAESDFRAAQERVVAAQRHMDELRAMRDGALMLVERYGQAHVADTGAGVDELSVKREEAALPEVTEEVPQTERVMGLFREYGTSLTTKQVGEKLPDLSPDQARSALGYLKRKGRIVRVGPATWRLPQVSAVTDSTPTAGPAGVGLAGENGHSSQNDVLTRAGAWPHNQ